MFLFILIPIGAMTEESDNGAEWQGDHDMFSDPEEQKHLFSVLDSFR